MPESDADDAPKAGLESAAELLKLTLALSTGALVFGAGFIEKNLAFTGWLKAGIVAAWVLLAVAAGAGILAIAAVPMMLSKKNYTLEDPYLTWPARVHQIAFVLGIVCLGGALAVAFFRTSPTQENSQPEAGTYVVIEQSAHETSTQACPCSCDRTCCARAKR